MQLNSLIAVPYKVPSGLNDQPLRIWRESHGWPIKVEPMTLDAAMYWDKNIFPRVQTIEALRIISDSPSMPPRADAYWKLTWGAIYRVFKMVPCVPSGPSLVSLQKTRPQLWQITAPNKSGQNVPIGLLLGLSDFRRAGLNKNQHFTWLLTSAPDEFLSEVGIPEGLAIGRALLDTVIQVSFATQCNGYVLLHADPMGGHWLMDFYKKAMMEQVSLADSKISPMRKNDGRYFEYDDGRALAYSSRLNKFRRNPSLKTNCVSSTSYEPIYVG